MKATQSAVSAAASATSATDATTNANTSATAAANAVLTNKAAVVKIDRANVSNATWTTLCTVDGNNLGSAIKLVVNGTAGGTVINNTIDILANHYQDILITSNSTAYTRLSVRVVTNGNEDFAIQLKTNTATTCITNCEIYPLNSEVISDTTSNPYDASVSTNVLEHYCDPGISSSATGGFSADIRTDGSIIVDKDITAVNFHGDGSALTGIDLTGKLDKSGGTMTGSLHMADNAGIVSVNSESNGSMLRVIAPGGGTRHNAASTDVGAIRITLPVGMTNGMLTVKATIYEYSTNESFEVVFGGYNYPTGNTWTHNAFGYIVGSPLANQKYAIRFGITGGGMACVYIGETNTSWSYPQIAVTEASIGYSNSTDPGLYDDNWAVDIVGSFENVTKTISATDTRAGGSLNSQQVFTSGGTWSKPAGVSKVKVYVTAGGQGGSAHNTDDASGGGGAGGTAIKIIDVTNVSTVSVTVGSGGPGRCGNTSLTGHNGGTSSFGSYCSASSSNGNQGNSWAGGGNGGTATGGDLNLRGGMGTSGNIDGYGNSEAGGSGGASFWGSGSAGGTYWTNPGDNGAPGGGGGGTNGQRTDCGSPGQAGIVVVEEYR
jgi:hypothetical protein